MTMGSKPDDVRARAEKMRRVPINRFFGMTLVACRRTSAEITLPMRAAYLQEEGIVHGGIVTALADTAAVYSLLPGLPQALAMTGIEFKMNFLEPVMPGRGPLTALARAVRRGRTIGLSQVKVSQQDRLVALGTFTYLFRKRSFQKGARGLAPAPARKSSRSRL
jgi:uncharacterized protein (TIGR00369 family)